MEVFVTLKLDIDPEAWDLAYGTGTDPGTVRDDVRRYAFGQVADSAAVDDGGIIDVKLRYDQDLPEA
jgi:hypothetical protein